MTTTTTTPSYADVLHRLSLGQSVWGGELRRLPAATLLDWTTEAEASYALPEAADVLSIALNHAKDLASCDDLELLTWEAYRAARFGQPLPYLFRAGLWQVGVLADLAVGLLKPGESLCQAT